MSSNGFARTSVLEFTTENKQGKTILKDCYFTPPFKITKPFYIKENEMRLIVMSASAGMLSGDTQQMKFRIGEGTEVYYTTQSYEKIHKMEEGKASRNLHIVIEKQACLKYIPLSTIPFADSYFESTLTIELVDDTSKLFMAEIISAGRIAYHEKFQYKCYQSVVKIKKQGQWIYRENTCYKPKEWEMNGYGIFESYTHLASITIINYKDINEKIECIREILHGHEEVYGGASISDADIMTIRILGNNAQQLEKLIEEILIEIEMKK